MRLRQVVLAAGDLKATRTAIEDELGLPHVWADPGVAHFGLHNALYAIGDCFLEVVSPFRPDAPAQRHIDRSGGDAGYMAILQSDIAIASVRAQAAALGIRVVFEAKGEGITGLHLHPSDTGGTLLSIDECDEPAEWPWAGPAWKAAPGRGWTGVSGATFAVADPEGVARRWAKLTDHAQGSDHRIPLDGSVLTFVPVGADGRAGLVGIELAGAEARPPVRIAGVDFTVAAGG